jgi:hypothetical protein
MDLRNFNSRTCSTRRIELKLVLFCISNAVSNWIAGKQKYICFKHSIFLVVQLWTRDNLLAFAKTHVSGASKRLVTCRYFVLLSACDKIALKSCIKLRTLVIGCPDFELLQGFLSLSIPKLHVMRADLHPGL